MLSDKLRKKQLKKFSYVFVAHRKDDLPIVQKIQAAFETKGRKCWLYEYNTQLKTDVLTKVKEAMRMCRAFVAVITSDKPEHLLWICTELGMALANDLPVALLAEESTLPAGFSPLHGYESVFRFQKGREDGVIPRFVDVVSNHIPQDDSLLKVAAAVGILFGLSAMFGNK